MGWLAHDLFVEPYLPVDDIVFVVFRLHLFPPSAAYVWPAVRVFN
jgi:hypothetical protein